MSKHNIKIVLKFNLSKNITFIFNPKWKNASLCKTDWPIAGRNQINTPRLVARLDFD